ncbi:MAG: cytochrome c biogenesis protein CcsA [Alphaproteobacteria bacterium]
MANAVIYDLAALAAMVPAALVTLRREGGRDAVYGLALAAAVAGPVALSALLLAGSWQTSLSIALWVSVAVSMVLFAGLAAVTAQGWRLTPLLVPYLAGLGLIATIWQTAPGHPLTADAPAAWVQFHILVSVTTYGLLTIAAVAALAAFLQERALKNRKRQGVLTRLLPSIADSERLSGRLLLACESVLGLGLASGMALQYLETGVLLRVDHKTLLSLMAFAVIGLLLVANRLVGMRGRAAARLVLLAYLLLTLAYPGVKFVTDVLVH